LTLAGLLNFLRKGQFVTQDQINKTIQEFHEMTPPISGAQLKSKTIKQSDLRLKTSTFSTPSIDVTIAPTRGRGIIPMLRVKPETVKSYPLLHSTVGTLTFPVAGDTKFGSGAVFDGSSYITVDDHSRLNPTDEISFGGWFYPKSSSGLIGLIKKNAQYILRQNDNLIEAGIRKGASFGTFAAFDISGLLDQWNHFFGTWKSPTLKLYVNGSLVDSVTRSGAMNTSTSKLGIGADGGGTEKVPNGYRMAWISILHKEVSSSWITDHQGGLLDTSGTNVEITTIPFTGSVDAKSDATSGECRSD